MSIVPETICTDISGALGINVYGDAATSTIGDPELMTPVQQTSILDFTLRDGIATCDSTVMTILSAYIGLTGAVALAIIGAMMLASKKPYLLWGAYVIQWPTLLAYLTPVFVIGKIFSVFDVREGMPILLTILFLAYPILTIIHRSLEHAAKNYEQQAQGNNLRFLFLIAFPAALPQILIGIRLAVPWAILGAMLGEWVGAQPGLGYTIAGAVTQVRMTHLLVYALVAGVSAAIPMLLIQLAIHIVYKRFHLNKRDITFEPARVESEPLGWTSIMGTAMILIAVWILAHQATPGFVPSLGEMIDSGMFKAANEEIIIATLVTLTVTALSLLVGVLFGFALALVTFRNRLFKFIVDLHLLPLQILPLLIFVPLLYHLDAITADLITIPTTLDRSAFTYLEELRKQRSPFVVGVLACTYVAYQIGLARLHSLPDGFADAIPTDRSSWWWPPFRHIYLPWLSQAGFLAVEVSLPRIFLAVVVTEALVSNAGLGHLLESSYAKHQFALGWFVILATCALSLAMFVLAQQLRQSSKAEKWAPVGRSLVPADDIRHTPPSLASSTLTTLAAAILVISTLDSEVLNTPVAFFITAKTALLGFSISVLIVFSISAYYIEQSSTLILGDYYLPKKEWFIRFFVYTALFLVFYFLATDLKLFFVSFVMFIGAMLIWSWYLTSFGPLNFISAILSSNGIMLALAIVFSFFAFDLVYLAEEYNRVADLERAQASVKDALVSLKQTNTRKVQENLNVISFLLGIMILSVCYYIYKLKFVRTTLKSMRHKAV